MRRRKLPEWRALLPSNDQPNPPAVEIQKLSWNHRQRSTYYMLLFSLFMIYFRLNQQRPALLPLVLEGYDVPLEILATYTNKTACTLTIVIAEPSLPLLPSNDMAYVNSLESTAEYAPPGSCFVIQTSGCALRKIVDEKNVHPATVVKGGKILSSKHADKNNNYTSWNTRQLVSTSIHSRSGPHLTEWIDSGRVRLTILNHTTYNFQCDSYNVNALWMNSHYYTHEFLEQDSDTLLFIQRDSFLCRPFDVDKWKQFAYVGGPWMRGWGRLGIGTVRSFWRRGRGGFHVVDGLREEKNGSYSVNQWKEYWQSERGKTCSVEQGLENCTIREHPPNFPDAKLHKKIYGMVGNGGLSLRSRTWMLRAIHICPYPPYAALPINLKENAICTAHDGMRLQEDVYFSAILGAIGAPLPTALEAQLFVQDEPWTDELVPTRDVLEETVSRLFGEDETDRHVLEQEGIKSFRSVGYHKCWEPANCPCKEECKYSTVEEEITGSRLLWWIWGVLVRLWLWVEDAVLIR